MIPETTAKEIGTVADERVAKVFIVMDDNTRKCLICEQAFSREASYEHSKTICYPPASSAN